MVPGRGARRVDDGRGDMRIQGVTVTGGFSLDAGASICTIAPFPIPAHQTVHGDFSHTAFRLTSPQGPQRSAHLIGPGKNTPSSPKTLSNEYRRMPRACTLCCLTGFTFRLRLRLAVKLLLESPDLFRCLQAHCQSPLLAFRSMPKVRGLPSIPFPELPRYYSPLRLPPRPASKILLGATTPHP